MNFIKSFTCLSALLLLSPFIAQAQESEFGEDIQISNAQLTLVDNVTHSTRQGGLVDFVVEQGALVEQGELIVRLDQQLYQAELAAAQAERHMAETRSSNDINIRFSEKSAELGKKILQRSVEANRRFAKSVPLTEIDQQKLEVEKAVLGGEQAELEQKLNDGSVRLMEAREKIAELNLQARQTNSKLKGQVAEVFAQPGEWIAPNQPIVRVINLERLRVEALVNKKYAFKVRPGQPAIFELDLDDQSIEVAGQVVFVSDEINPSNDRFLVRIEIDNQQRNLKPGLTGSLTISIDE